MEDIKSVGKLLDRLYQKLGRRYGSLSRPQRRFLQTIASVDGIGVKELSNFLEITAAGATRMLDSLENEGYIERRRQVHDARHVKVFLTERGANVLAEADEIYLSRLGGVLAPLSSDERQLLSQLLNKVDLTDGGR
ncbi:MarR family winged helix-turn-helix transcriptional regulator [Alicyclobacillus fastidiosus]|uniref:MarR family winged helix-turn-helix transcriptional regulator n=1 Tax=Alicyclobacillus fastidiosus TaxID=392011 RepID=A0ABV5AJH3_9BACL|nr:MarR family winged helix-turn-helix transcriptional regulator [Alicyclobacillus fastidiosus]WEH08282.1 MarR family winged helix-turn-helix transcriptional regulator [Alicyclobacillus fastidiosus]